MQQNITQYFHDGAGGRPRIPPGQEIVRDRLDAEAVLEEALRDAAVAR